MNLVFRLADQNDCDSLADFINAAYRGESSTAGWTTESHLLDGQRTDADALREIMSIPDSNFLLAFDENSQLIGSVHLEKRANEVCYLGMFTVKPTSQTQGIGKSLLLRAEQFAREVYKSSTMEMTVITVRSELLAWYVRRGYHRTGRIVPFPAGTRFGVLKVPFLEMEVLDKSVRK